MSDEQGTCPLGGLWYTCTAQSPTFFGCCTSDPCNGVGCPMGGLRAAGMGTGSGPDLAINDSSFWPNVNCSRGLWWTCAAQTPSFQGCCGSNPCGGKGCPSSLLYPAAFSTIPASLSPTAASTSPTSTKSSTSSSSSLITSSSSSLITSSSSSLITSSSSSLIASAASQSSSPLPSTSSSSASSSSTNVGAIAGGVAGGVVFAILLGIIFYLLRRLRKRRHSVGGDSGFAGGGNDKSAFPGVSTVYGQMNFSNTPHTKPLPSPSNTNQTSLTPRTPAPPYGTEAHELPTSTHTSYGSGNEGLGLASLEALQEAEAQSDTPNPYPVQKRWSARRRPELPDAAAMRADGDAVDHFVGRTGVAEDPQRRQRGRDSYNSWQTYSE